MNAADRRRRDMVGRYATEQACDGCGRPVGPDYLTDTEVCGGTDGPGFYLCARKRCMLALVGLDVDARRARYTATRARVAAAERIG